MIIYYLFTGNAHPSKPKIDGVGQLNITSDYICTRVAELETNCEIIRVKLNIVGCKT